MLYIVVILTFAQHFGWLGWDKFVFKLKLKHMKPLDFYKSVLEKVSFNQSLFDKELQKAKRDLSPKDQLTLVKWHEIRMEALRAKDLQS